jgi:hypothetical protein
MSDAEIAVLRARLDRLEGAEESDGVWPDNVAVVRAFLAASSQWRSVVAGGGLAPARIFYVGLDYAGAKVAIDALGIAITPELFVGIQVMEDAAREILNAPRR